MATDWVPFSRFPLVDGLVFVLGFVSLSGEMSVSMLLVDLASGLLTAEYIGVKRLTRNRNFR